MISSVRHDAPTILIIENDTANRFLAEKILALSGYRYLSAAHGKAALELLDQHHVDLILTDLSMPVLDGFAMARLIRARPEHAVTPIVALTAHTRSTERQQALGVGCTDVLTKPYRPKELVAMISRYLTADLVAHQPC